MSKGTLWILFCLWSLALFTGCSDRASFETRRDSDINSFRERLASTKSPVRTKWSQDVLSALDNVDGANILKPRLASAILSNVTNGDYHLFVFWIEDQPSVSALEFEFSEGSSLKTNIFLDIELEQVRNEAKVGIVFGSEQDWEYKSETWEHLERITNTHGMKLRLLRGKTPATDWFPVAFYKKGRWIPEELSDK